MFKTLLFGLSIGEREHLLRLQSQSTLTLVVWWTRAVQAVEEANTESVFPRLPRADQRVVPVSLGYAEGNFTKEQLDAWDEICTTNGECGSCGGRIELAVATSKGRTMPLTIELWKKCLY